MVKEYFPRRGDLVWLDFNPQLGHEQRGRRPALVISHESYNKKTGLALLCPVTSKVKGYPFEVELDSPKIQGALLSDQVKSMNWRMGRVEFIEKISNEKMDEVIQKLTLLLG